jgi:hypothetical protein
MFGGRLLDIVERVVAKGDPRPAAGRPRRSLRHYLTSYDFWVGGVFIGLLFLIAGQMVQCGWFRR